MVMTNHVCEGMVPAFANMVADLLDRREVIMITGPNASNSYWPNSHASVDHGLSREHQRNIARVSNLLVFSVADIAATTEAVSIGIRENASRDQRTSYHLVNGTTVKMPQCQLTMF